MKLGFRNEEMPALECEKTKITYIGVPLRKKIGCEISHGKKISNDQCVQQWKKRQQFIKYKYPVRMSIEQ